jgi:hypothetical protein
VGSVDHFISVRSPELARMLALQKRTAKSRAGFLCPFAWLVLFFAVRTRWRLVLLLVTIPALAMYANGRWGLVEMNSGAESGPFQALQQLQSTISASRKENDYPDALPSMNLRCTRKSITVSNIFHGARQMEKLSATSSKPLRRGATANFTEALRLQMTDRSSWTLEPRAATLSDTYYNE